MCVPPLQVAQIHGLKRFQAGVRHLLHVLLDQAALGAHLAAQVALHALPGLVDEAHVLLVGRREDLAAGAGGTRAAAPLAVVNDARHGGAGHGAVRAAARLGSARLGPTPATWRQKRD